MEINRMLNKFYEDNVTITTHNIKDNAGFVDSLVNEILEEVNKRDRRFKKQPLHVGSFYTDLKGSRADEFDYSVVLDVGSSLVWNHKPHPYYRVQNNKEVVRKSNQLQCPPVGKTFVEISAQIQHWNNNGLNEGPACLTENDCIIPRNVKRWFKALVNEVSETLEKPRIHQYVNVERLSDSPATTLTIKHPTTGEQISVDLALLIKGHIPFKLEFGWPRPGARWPSCTKIQEIIAEGIHLVAKDPLYWSLSFVICEQKLLDGVDSNVTCRKKSHRILKKLREMWCLQRSKQEFTSYHLKNILFWEYEIHPDDSEWTDEQLSIRVVSMCYSLIYHILRGNLPLYFHTGINLLEKKDRKVLIKVAENILKFLKNPEKILVPNML